MRGGGSKQNRMDEREESGKRRRRRERFGWRKDSNLVDVGSVKEIE